jgi:L-lactate dehydrogenase (cytochrome)
LNCLSFWRYLDWIRECWEGPIIIKGVLDVVDAREVVKVGAQGIVVSTHGGRQLDGVRSSISALPAIVDAVGADLEVFLDGDVRSSLAVLKALALGAGGQTVVARMLAKIKAELEAASLKRLQGLPSCSRR